MDYLFVDLCRLGNLEGAKQLLKENPNINISASNEYAFCDACQNDRLEVAKWLLEIKPDINISVCNEYIFRWACENRHLEIAKWLQTLCPDKYYLEIINNKIINYKIKQIIKNKIKIEKEQIVNCFICNENISNVQTSCNHFYCESCITLWLEKSSSCPYCREPINYDNLFKIET